MWCERHLMNNAFELCYFVCHSLYDFGNVLKYLWAFQVHCCHLQVFLIITQSCNLKEIGRVEHRHTVSYWKKIMYLLSYDRLLSENGISALRDNLCNMTFKGQGYEVRSSVFTPCCNFCICWQCCSCEAMFIIIFTSVLKYFKNVCMNYDVYLHWNIQIFNSSPITFFNKENWELSFSFEVILSNILCASFIECTVCLRNCIANIIGYER